MAAKALTVSTSAAYKHAAIHRKIEYAIICYFWYEIEVKRHLLMALNVNGLRCSYRNKMRPRFPERSNDPLAISV